MPATRPCCLMACMLRCGSVPRTTPQTNISSVTTIRITFQLRFFFIETTTAFGFFVPIRGDDAYDCIQPLNFFVVRANRDDGATRHFDLDVVGRNAEDQRTCV